jgi:prepilin-type N-terminal cleavage/methylation domain-containing protein
VAKKKSIQGFTLIELMVVVAILGVLSALAIPAFIGYMRRARTSEAVQTIQSIYASAAALYASERATRGISSNVVTACVAETTSLSPSSPNADKQAFTGGAGFDQLVFKQADYVYFGYGISSVAPAGGGIACVTNPTALDEVYTFFAEGDLDDDGVRSTFELAVGASGGYELYHARGFHIVNEIE